MTLLLGGKIMTLSSQEQISRTLAFFEKIENMTPEEKEVEIDLMFREMFPNKNHDLLPYELNKEYTWKNFQTYDLNPLTNEFEWNDAICKFKVTKVIERGFGPECVVEYLEGEHKGKVCEVPLIDMPLTVEERGEV